MSRNLFAFGSLDKTDLQMNKALSLYRRIVKWAQWPDPLLESNWIHLVVDPLVALLRLKEDF